ncbi:MAG TPA: DUF302 domain-containing protein [Patescibacteria group bacterium]|nr:DUF302 domain-containing protein [Patescibacteria group bacterium]
MLHRIQTSQTPLQVIKRFRDQAKEHNFVIRNIFNMKEVFASHGAEVKADESYYSVMVCNPSRAYQSIRKNPDRGAVLLQPKQIFVYKREQEEKTTISYLGLDKNFLSRAIPEDEDFQEKLPCSCQKIVDLIQGVVAPGYNI